MEPPSSALNWARAVFNADSGSDGSARRGSAQDAACRRIGRVLIPSGKPNIGIYVWQSFDISKKRIIKHERLVAFKSPFRTFARVAMAIIRAIHALEMAFAESNVSTY